MRRGLTILELLVALAILAVTAALATEGTPTMPVAGTSSTSTTTTAVSAPSTSTTVEVAIAPLERCEIAKRLTEKALTACRAARELDAHDAALRSLTEAAAVAAGVPITGSDYDVERGVFRPHVMPE